MTVHGPSSRFAYIAGYNVGTTSGTAGVQEFQPGGIERTLDDLTGPMDINPRLADALFESSPPLAYKLWADDSFQDFMDALFSVGESDGATRSDKVGCWGTAGDTAEANFTGALLKDAKVKVEEPARMRTKFAVEHQINGAEEPGIILKARAAVTADGDTEASSYDAGAGSSSGGAGYFQCTAITLDTATNLAVTVRDSADDITYADLAVFTAITAISGQRVAVSGSVDRYLTAEWDFTGTAGSETATIFVGFARF